MSLKRKVSDKSHMGFIFVRNMELFDLNSFGNLTTGVFLERKNRFVGTVKVNNKIFTCHISDTGRLKEILNNGRKVLLAKNKESLKTDFKLVAAYMEDGWVLINTSVHSKIAYNAIKNGVLGFTPKIIKKEVPFGKSRIDFLVDNNHFIELKGSNLLIKDKCLFPDAPTERGKKHILELISSVKEGFKATILIMGLRNCRCFSPNKKLDPEFHNLFFKGLKSGVKFKGFKISINSNFKVIYSGEMKLCDR
ncbi:DNA/RNA nuclease SfsA [Persephonella sp.]